MSSHPDFLAGGGEMGERMRAYDWSRTPLGPLERWQRSLKTVVRIMLTSRQPFWLGWGPELTYLYNDPYKAIIGGRHPHALGKPFREVWPETWHLIGPMGDRVMQHDESTYVEAMLLIMERNGYPEETYYTFSYSPVPGDDGRTAGLICANTDDTRRVIAERQVATLRELGARTAGVKAWRDACVMGVEALSSNRRDVPFAFVRIGDERDPEMVCASSGAQALAKSGRFRVGDSTRSDEVQVVPLDASFGEIPAGDWPRPPSQAAVLPIGLGGNAGGDAALVVGLNPFRKLDESYRDFLKLAATQLGGAIANAQAYEDEKKRAEALAEIDRAKTVFFSNVSHEFRTPLTLMLGPLEEALASSAVPREAAESLGVAHRNSLRLLKLVNTLLDFSRLEAGRIDASYEPVDLPACTAELASVFRSAVEKAGLKLVVECPPLPGPVHVDRDMWEKIVLNLLSNAFKFTFEGTITLAMRLVGSRVELAVSDTGVGIPEPDVPRLFQRFHRVSGTRSRTHEGSGIGLALVQELVKLHGGEVSVRSREGHGTTFTVVIPTGVAHLPADRIHAAREAPATGLGPAPFVEEARRWLSIASGDVETTGPHLAMDTADIPAPPRDAVRACVLVADDNADMRDYVRRLLGRDYEVATAADGKTALEWARVALPDLVLTDVMMPELDGFGLLRELRADSRTRDIPVIMLSARAGEENRVEGMQAGADDYLIKPFGAREILARVGAHVQMARLRREAGAARRAGEAQVRKLAAIVETSDDAIISKDLNGIITSWNRGAERLFGYTEQEALGRPITMLIPPERLNEEPGILQRIREGRRIEHYETVRIRKDGTLLDISLSVSPIKDDNGKVVGASKIARDITERKRAEEALRESDKRKDEFLAMLSHELRNPLAPMRHAVTLLQQADDGETRRLAYAILDRQVEHMTRLVEDLLDISRISRGEVDMRRQRIDLAEVVRIGIETSRPLVDAAGHQLDIVLPREPVSVVADRLRLAQVVSNLLNNAAKYTPAGGRIGVELSKSNGSALISVRDNGIGISANDMPRLFSMYTQLEGGRRRSPGGLGVGLALARQLVELHGGTIEASSGGTGQGSKFVIRIPTADPGPRTGAAA